MVALTNQTILVLGGTRSGIELSDGALIDAETEKMLRQVNSNMRFRYERNHHVVTQKGKKIVAIALDVPDNVHIVEVSNEGRQVQSLANLGHQERNDIKFPGR